MGLMARRKGRNVAVSRGELGLDIVEIERIRRVAAKTPKFLSRVFSKDEIAYCRGKKLMWQHFAVRFAAKEAVWKVLGQRDLSLKDISISRDASGRPGVILRGRPVRGIKISLSHSGQFALAVAMAAKPLR